jgi:hypothetical protein
MITVSPHPTELFGMTASVNGLAVFLDNFAIISLAKGDSNRRRRFIATLNRGVDVLFSVSNAAELSGPQGDSFITIREFLDEIGTRWFPMEFDPYECIKRERQLQNLPFFCERLLKTFTAERLRRSPEIKIADLPASLPSDFFRLGLFMDWLAPRRDQIIDGKRQMGLSLRDQIMAHWAEYRKDPGWLDAKLPELPLTVDRPATYLYGNLLRLLVREAKSRMIMPNDGVDFSHAVIGTAYASIATLDKHWKQRVETILPKASGLARIYYQPELDKMVRDIERLLDNASLERGRALCSLGS